MAAGLGRVALRKAVDNAMERASDEEEARASASALLDQMDDLKGLALKLGQTVSYLDGMLPPAGQRVLRRLQRQAKPMEPEVAVAIVERELGRSVEEAFDAFEPMPFAAASIGQVHRARIGDRDVAVKVQYPEIARTLEIDLGNLDRLGLLAAVGSGVRSRGVVGELRARLLEECDYRREALHQRTFAHWLGDDPSARVPEVVRSHSTERVLTTELALGQDFYTFAEQAPQEARDRAGQAIYRFAFQSIFQHSAFNADPHPGNYLFGSDHVVFLDFGCVRLYRAGFIDVWKRLAKATMAGDRATFAEAFEASGFVAKKGFDLEHQWRVMMYLYEPMLSSEPFRYTPQYVQRSWDALIKDNPNLRRLDMPPEWVFANRLQWGMNSVLAALGATAVWGDIYRPLLELPSVDGQLLDDEQAPTGSSRGL